jgi:hypothetical protein
MEEEKKKSPQALHILNWRLHVVIHDCFSVGGLEDTILQELLLTLHPG